MIVYKITNMINNKAYIGQTIKTLKYRWYQHCCSSSHCRILSRAIKKYGKENFLLEILAETESNKELIELEKSFIKDHETLNPKGYNMTTGGEDASHLRGKKLSKETRKKMSLSRQGEKHPMWGKNHSKETCEKMSKAKKGCYRAIGKAGHPVRGTHVITGEIIEFVSMSQAHIQGGFTISAIAASCKGTYETHKKYRWEKI